MKLRAVTDDSVLQELERPPNDLSTVTPRPKPSPSAGASSLVPVEDPGTLAELNLRPVEDPDVLSQLDPPGAGDYLAEFGKGVPAGAISSTGTAAKGLAYTARKGGTDLRRRQLEAIERVDAGETVPETEDPAGYQHMDEAQRTALKADLAQDVTPLEETGMYQAGEGMQEYAREQFPTDPRFQGSLTSGVGQGFGSVAPFLALAATGPMSLATGSLYGSWLSAGEALERAVEAGATPEEATEAAQWGQLPGLTEQLPIEMLFDRVPAPAIPKLVGTVGRILRQAVAEGGQEAAQETLQNIIAKYTYSPDQEITEGVAEAAGIGAIVGGGLRTGVETGRAAIGKKEQKAPENPEEQPAAPEGLKPVPPEQAAELGLDPSQDVPALRPEDGEPDPEVADDVTVVRPATAVEAEGEPLQPEPEEVQVAPEDVALLRAAGFQDDQIADMGDAERVDAVAEARDQGIEPADFSPLKREGSREAPATVESEADLAPARAAVETEPTDGQKEAGNYRKGHVKLQGLDIAIENPRGSERRGRDTDGEEWSVTMPADYGYVKRTEGSDGDQVDVYIGEQPESDRVFVIDQVDPETKEWDEHKAVLGTADRDAALDLYSRSFSDGRGAERVGGVQEMSVPEFRDWLAQGKRSEPVAPPPEAASAQTEISEPAGTPKTEAAPREAPRGDQPQSLFRYLASQGGIKDDRGELSALDLTRTMVPRAGRLVRRNGLPLDTARELAADAGYLADTAEGGATMSDLLDALDREARGERVFSSRDRAQVETQRQADQARKATEEMQSRFTEEELAARDEHGPALFEFFQESDTAAADWHPEDLRRARELIETGVPADEALERAAIENEASSVEEAGLEPATADAIVPSEQSDEAQPSRASGEGRPVRGEREERERSAQEGRAEPERPSVRDAGEGRAQPRGQARLDDEPDLPEFLRRSKEEPARAARAPQEREASDAEPASESATTRVYMTGAPRIGDGWRNIKVLSLGPKWARVRETASGRTVRLRRGDWDRIAASARQPESERAGVDEAVRGAVKDPAAVAEAMARGVSDKDLLDIAGAGRRITIEVGGEETVLANKKLAVAIRRAFAHEPVAPTRNDERSAARRRYGIPAEVDPPITSYSGTKAIKSHVEYEAAKGGDRAAAARLVADVVNPETVREAERRFGRDAIYVPVIAEEATGRNKIPELLAHYYAEATGANATDLIIQASRAYHTGARPLQRLISRPTFDGHVEPGRRYVLVDDVTVMGGTLAELANHIRANGGEVAGAITLVNAGRSGLYTPKANHVRQIEARFGEEIREQFGVEPSALTADEAVYALGFPDAERLRNSVAKARGQRDQRLRAAGVLPPEAEDASLAQLTGSSEPVFYSALDRRSTDDTDLPREQVQQEVQDLAEQVLGRRLRVNLIDSFGEGMEDRQALYNPTERLITIALESSRDPGASLRHEAVHALRDMGVITRPEWSALARMAHADWIERYRIREKYERLYRRELDVTDAQLEELLIEEAVAEAFASYSRNPESDQSIASRIFERLRRLLEAVGNYLTGRGFHSVEDIFGDIESGRMAARPEGHGDGRGFALRRRLSQLQDTTSFTPPMEHSFSEWADRTQPLMMRVSNASRGAFQNVRRKMQDRFIDVKRMQEAIEKSAGAPLQESMNAYLTESLYYGRAGQRLDDLRQDVVEPLIDEIGKRNLSLEEVDEFLYARHAPERNARIAEINPDIPEGGSGMTDAEAAAVIDRFDRKGKLQDLQEIAGRVDGLNKQSRQTLVKAGLISEEELQQWEEQYQHYVPLRGWEGGDPQAAEEHPRVGRRFDVRGREAFEALGRRSKADSPLTYVVSQAQQAIIRAEKNRVGKSFLRLVQNNPNPDVWEIDKKATRRQINPSTGLVDEVHDHLHRLSDNVFAVKVGGETHYITLHHPGLARALKGLGTDPMGIVVRGLAALNRFLAAINTSFNPEFVISNFVRDFQTAGVHLSEAEIKGLQGRVIRDVLSGRALRGAYQGLRGRTDTEWSRYFREFADAGGKIGFFGLTDIETLKRRLLRDLGRINPTAMQRGVKGLEAVGDYIQTINGAVENGVRLATYVHARKSGVPKEKAASLARELTVNFNRKGEWGGVMNALYLFYNAAIQGSVRMIMALKHPKVRRIVYGVMAGSLLLDMINRIVSDEDDDGEKIYDKIPFYEKERNLILMVPEWLSEERHGKGGYMKMPLPYGYNVFHALGQQAGAVMFGPTNPVEASANVMTTAIGSFNPIGGGSTLLSQISPTIVDPVVELTTNRDWLDRKIKPEDFPGSVPSPESQKFWSTVNPHFQWMTEQINRATGGNEVRPGAIDVSPEILEYWVDFALGGVGRFGEKLSRLATWAHEGGKIEAREIPFGRKVYGEKTRYVDRELYYQLEDAVRLTEQEVKKLREHRKPDEARQVMRERRSEIRMIPMIKEARNRLKQVRKQIRLLRNRSDIDPERRQERIEALETKLDQIMLQVRKRFNALDRSATD